MYADDITLFCDMKFMPKAKRHFVVNRELENMRANLSPIAWVVNTNSFGLLINDNAEC